MDDGSLITGLKKFKRLILISLLFPSIIHASFIESTMGAAVVNDATAAYYNPAALALLKNTQLIALNSIAHLHTQFSGQSTQVRTGFTQTGVSSADTHYYLPSFYLGIPTTNKLSFGLAVISNIFNRDTEGNSLLRYVQASNSIQDIDIVPAVSVKLTDFLSLGAAMNFSYADFLLKPIYGFPSLNIPDSQSRNESSGNGIGEDIGLLLKPGPATLIGFNYRSAITYRLSGTSVFESNPPVISDHYGFNFWTPARSVLSINQFLTPTLGMIGTLQRIEWSIFKEIRIHGIATQIGTKPVTLNATVPYHLHDTWLLTLGGYYRITPKWIFRLASSYNESPGNSNYQISNGDSIIVGASTGYEITSHIMVDGSYAHAFIQKQNINVSSANYLIDGITSGFTDAFSLKLTVKL